MVLPFFLVYIIAIVFIILKSHYRMLFNDMFWLGLSWVLSVGMYFFSGIKWDYPLSIFSAFYIGLCFVLFAFFRTQGINTSVRLVKSPGKKKVPIPAGAYFVMGILGSCVYIWDYIRNNGVLVTKANYEISILGSIGNLFLPASLVLGLYHFAISFVNEKKISIRAILCMAVYVIPCIINGGRETILYLAVSVAAIMGYSMWKNRVSTKSRKNLKSFISKVIIAIVVIVLANIVINVSNNRFGADVGNFYFRTLNAPESLHREAELFGSAKNIYQNIVFYFAHQLSRFEVVMQEYHGPYLLGMFELNIISRRLPAVFELDYQLVSEEMHRIMRGVQEGGLLRDGWSTILTSLIFDFGKWLTPLICGILGFVVGSARRRFMMDSSLANLVMVSIICMAMFTTIQLGPFFNFSVYGAFIWWHIMFKSRFAVCFSKQK